MAKKMGIANKLEFLNQSKNFSVSKGDNCYTVTLIGGDYVAEIFNDGKEVTYYVTDCYNSGVDWIEIDVDSLMSLKNYCEFLMSGEEC